MCDIIGTLKLRDFAQTAKAEYNRLTTEYLIVIDGIMLFPIEKLLAVALFNFIKQIYEKTAFIITTNKSPSQWLQMLDDEVLEPPYLIAFCSIVRSLIYPKKASELRTRKQ